MKTPGFSGAARLEVTSERAYVVYDVRTGAIRHVHQSITFAGAAARSVADEEARALALAARFGHRTDSLRVLRAEAFDARQPQRVDVKAQCLVALKMAKTASRLARSPRRTPARPASGRPRRS